MKAICIFSFFVWLVAGTVAVAGQTSYDLAFRLDFDNRAWTGTERLRWTNTDDNAESMLYFRLYANAPDEAEPRLTVTEVKTAQGLALPFGLEERDATLRVNLREAVPKGGSVELSLTFQGVAPEIDAEETTLLAHVMQQVGAVLNDAPETRHPRETHFRGRGVMFLGAGYPILAARKDGKWQRKSGPGVSDTACADVAGYRVTVETVPDVKVFTSGMLEKNKEGRYRFAGEHLRDFALLAGRDLRLASAQAGGLEMRAVFAPQHEAVGRRVLQVAVSAARIYQARFGPLPLKQVSILEAPLVAGLGSTEFSGGGAIASAFYVDFDSPTMRTMPDMIRQQREAVEESLEWTVARAVAQQWWGVAVGHDSGREPVLQEALTNWSALLYYADTYGPERAERAANEQLRGVYKIYRTFGGRDGTANRPARFYRNNFQLAALVSSKGALLLQTLRKLLGDENFFAALNSYYTAQQSRIAEFADLRAAFRAQTPPAQQKAVARAFNRWLAQKRGDEDLAPPDPKLADALGLPPPAKSRTGNRLGRLGKFFWQQMIRIR